MTTEKKPKNNLTQNQFETFLLIYAAHVDFDFSNSEQAFILARTDKATYEAMLDLFSLNGDYACLKIILNHKSKFYQDKSEQDRIFKLLIDIFEVDGEYSRIEKSFVDFFKRIIHTEWT